MLKRLYIYFIIGVTALTAASTDALAQQAMGSPGLINVPTAEMDTVGMARVGFQFIPKCLIPDKIQLDGEKFDSWTNYLSITPFHWVEVGYGYTLWKFHKNKNPKREVGFYAKDRYFSARIQPLREGRWWPALAIGGNDVWGTGDDGESGSFYYRNFYVAATKHFQLADMVTVGTHLTYRKWKRDYNHRWNGVVGGLTVSPDMLPELKLIAEWNGNGVNAGVDYRLLRYFQFQAALVQGKYFTGGLCLMIPLIR